MSRYAALLALLPTLALAGWDRETYITTSAATASAGPLTQGTKMIICSVDSYVRFGSSGVTATTNDLPIAAGARRRFVVSTLKYVAAIGSAGRCEIWKTDVGTPEPDWFSAEDPGAAGSSPEWWSDAGFNNIEATRITSLGDRGSDLFWEDGDAGFSSALVKNLTVTGTCTGCGGGSGWVTAASFEDTSLSNQTDNDQVLMSAAATNDTIFRFSGWIQNLTFGNGFGGVDADFTDCEGNAIGPFVIYGNSSASNTPAYNADQSGERVGYYTTTLCVNAGTTLNIRFDCGGGLASTFRAAGTLEKFIP